MIFPILKDLSKADGILVKNEGIRKGFIANGVDVDTLEFNTTGVYNGEEKIYGFSPGRYARIFQYNVTAWKKILEYIGSQHYDFIWFRIPILTPPIAWFVKGLKKKYPGCTILLEYGAFPYVNELPGYKQTFYRLNRGYEKMTHRNADFVITYCGQERVDNLPNIPINNGIDLENIPVATPGAIGERLNFISVSSLKKWHAYERFIAGLPDYLQKKDHLPVHFDIVGNGPEYEKLVQLVESLNLKKYITFHKFKTGKELDDIYARNHVAIGTLGFHRIGITNSSSLKNREYFARGLPIVLSTPDLDMPPELPYVQYVPEGETPIDITAIVDFAKRAYQLPDLNNSIRQYAEAHVSWKSKIGEVLSYLTKQEAGQPQRAGAPLS